nr:NPCBM/NEW2 domain-containing protein [Stakelama sediminis]
MAPAAAIAGPLSPTGRWTANAQGNAPVPPMGWSSWNAFNSDIDEQKILGNAKVLVDSGLSRLGYRYVDIDDGWWLKRRQPDGRMVIRTSSFPSARLPGKDNSSFRPLTDRLHAMGLKAGIYSDIGRNSCGQIYTSNFANQPEGTQAEREVGLYGHVAQDISLYFKEWGFDLIKVDGCGIRGLAADTPLVRSGRYRALKPLVDMDSLGRTDIPAVRALYQQVADALARDNPDHDYVYSICLWGSANVREWAKDVGNISRTSDDISPSWSRMLSNLDSVSTRALYAEPGTWNDPDMLYIGSGDFDADHLTEARSHFALWAMMDAPLMIGMDMRKVSPALMAILGNADIVALDQDPAGNQAVPAFMSGDIQTFVKTLNTGEKAVAIFNRSLNPRKVTLTAEQLKYRPDADVVLTDLWSKAKTHFRGQTSFRIKPHQTLIFTAKGTRRLPNGLYLSEQPGMVNPAVDGVTVPTPDPTIHRSVPGWASTTGTGVYPQYGGWGGAQADRAPYGQSLSIAGHAYDTGIGILANSRMEVRNNGFTQFVASVGVDDSALPTDSPVVFEVYGDGKLLAQSQPKHFGEAPDRLKADVRGVSIVELVARATGKSPAPEPIAWANARLIH